jgi:hypothetical protein
MRIVKGSNGLQERQKDVAMVTSSSNSSGQFDVSAHISPPGERDAWMPTPLLRRPSDPLSNRTKFLIASAIAALLAGPFVFGSSDRPVDVAVAPQPTIDAPPPVAFLPLREAMAPSAEARGITVESRAEREVQTASVQPTVRLDIKPTESGIEARPPQALLERGRPFFAASGHDSTVESRAQPPEVQTAPLQPTVPLDIKPTESGIEARLPQTLPERGKSLVASGYDSTCFPSASAVRQNHPGGWPSWTLRAPGHEGTRCWYAATRTTAEAEAPSAKAKGITVESRAQPEVQTVSLQPTVRLDIKPTESGVEARPPQTLPERGKPLVAASGYDSTCLPSASAVRQNHPGGWPSWTLRAPGHEGTTCWYAATRTTANDHRTEMMPRKETAGTTETLGSPGVLFGVQ